MRCRVEKAMPEAEDEGSVPLYAGSLPATSARLRLLRGGTTAMSGTGRTHLYHAEGRRERRKYMLFILGAFAASAVAAVVLFWPW